MGKVKTWMLDLEEQVRNAKMISEVDIRDWDKGTKYDQDKPRMDLLDAHALEGLSKILTFGAQKYTAHNWRNGIAYSRIIAAMLRHLSAIQRGEDIDSESGLPHVDHLGCCWMFLSNFMKTRPDLDDRWKPNNKKYDQDHLNETFHPIK
jgi:hypothetical protein